MTTVGYGDFYAAGPLGRIIGPFLISTITIALSNVINFNHDQNNGFNKFQQSENRKRLEKRAVMLISAFAKLNYLKNKNRSAYVVMFWFREELWLFHNERRSFVVYNLMAVEFQRMLFNLYRNIALEMDLIFSAIPSLDSLSNKMRGVNLYQRINERDIDNLAIFTHRLLGALKEAYALPEFQFTIKTEDQTEHSAHSNATTIRDSLANFQKMMKKVNKSVFEENKFKDYLKKSPIVIVEPRRRISSKRMMALDDQDEIVKKLGGRIKSDIKILPKSTSTVSPNVLGRRPRAQTDDVVRDKNDFKRKSTKKATFSGRILQKMASMVEETKKEATTYKSSHKFSNEEEFKGVTSILERDEEDEEKKVECKSFFSPSN